MSKNIGLSSGKITLNNKITSDTSYGKTIANQNTGNSQSRKQDNNIRGEEYDFGDTPIRPVALQEDFDTLGGYKVISKREDPTISEAEISNWLSFYEETLNQIKSEYESLTSKYNDFMGPIYLSDPKLSKYLNEVFADSAETISHSIMTPTEYQEALKTKYGEDAYLPDTAKRIEDKVKEYTEIFNDLFTKAVGISYDEYKDKASELEEDILYFESSIYALNKQKIIVKYSTIKDSQEFKDYVDKKKNEKSPYTIDSLSLTFGILKIYRDGEEVEPLTYRSSINPMDIAKAMESGQIPSRYFTIGSDTNAHFYNSPDDFLKDIPYEDLTEEEKMMYSYLFDTQGVGAADEYMKMVADQINQNKGLQEATDFIKSISTPDGKIEWNIFTTQTLAAGKGVLDGIQNFGEGLAHILETEGEITQNQYAQMYILEALGEQDFSFGNQIMTSTYELGVTFGNMVPSQVAAILATMVATPAIGEYVGVTLMGASAAGNAKNEALLSGASLWQANIYGLLNGISEATLEKLLGNIGFLNTNAKLCIKGLFSEGLEEFMQEYIDAGLKAVILGEEVDMGELFGDASKSFIYGVLMSGITTSAQLDFNILINYNGAKANINSFNDFCDFVSLMNRNNAYISKKDGKEVFKVDGNTVEQELFDKIKKLFPNAIVCDQNDNIIFDGSGQVHENLGNNLSQTSMLDKIVGDLGLRGRRILAMYAANGNIDLVPKEYRNIIQSIPVNDIKNYLNADGTNLGFQFFSENSGDKQLEALTEPNDIYQYIRANADKVNDLYRSEEKVRKLFDEYFEYNVRSFTNSIINNLSEYSIDTEMINNILSLSDEEFSTFVKVNKNLFLFSYDAILQRAIDMGIDMGEILNDANVRLPNRLYLSNILQKIPDENILYECLSNDAIFKQLGSYKYEILSKLTPQHQLEIVNSKGMLLEDFNNTIKALSGENVRNYFSENPEAIELLNFDTLLYVYAKTGDNVYLTKFIQMLDDGKSINKSIRDLIIEENLLDKFTDEQIKKIFHYSNFDGDSVVEFAQYIDKISNQHYKELLQPMLDEAINDAIKNSLYSDLFEVLSNESVYSAVEEKFKNDPNALDSYIYSLPKVKFDEIKNLIGLLSPEGKLGLLTLTGVMENMQYVEEVKALVLSDSSLFTSLLTRFDESVVVRFLNSFSDEERLLLYESLPLDKLLMFHKNFHEYDVGENHNACVIKAVNSAFNKLSPREQVDYLLLFPTDLKYEFFQNIDCFSCSVHDALLILDEADTNELKALIINKIFNEKNMYIDTCSPDDPSMISLRLFLSRMDSQTFNFFIKNVPSDILLCCYAIQNNPSIENEIMSRFNTDSNIFSSFAGANIILQNLSEENRLKVERAITENFKKNFDNTVLANLIDSDYLGLEERAKLNYALKKRYITSENMDLVASMYAKNPYVFKTLNIELLNPDIMSIGPTFIEKLSRYPEHSQNVVELYCFNPQEFKVFGEIVKTFEEADSLNIYNNKLIMVLEYFESHMYSPRSSDIDFNSFTPSDCRNFFDYIVHNIGIKLLRSADKITYKGNFDSNYKENYNNYLDDLFASATTIDEKKNVFLTKKYGLSTKEVSYLLTMFYDHISELNLSDGSEILDYFENLKRSFEIEDIDQLNELYKGITESATDVLYMINEVRKAYAQTYLDALSDTEKMINNAMNGNTAFYDAGDFTFDKLNGTAVVNYNGKEIPIISLVDNFSLLVNSTNAIGGMDVINNNYSDSWNLSTRTKNHGICCSYITADNLGTAGVGLGGVLFGFYGFANEALVVMGPSDIGSYLDDISIESFIPEFVSARELPSQTRQVYNEMVIERTELRPDVNSQYSNIQPDCVVIFADWSDELKMTALKAASDFEKPLQVIYIDRVAVAKNESAKIDAMLQLFEENPGNLEYLESAIDLHESNRTVFEYSNDALNVDEYFPTEKITNVIDNWITSWTMLYQNEPSIEVGERLGERLETLKTILLDEQEKLSYIKLDLNVPEIIGKIDQLLGVIKERTGGND